MMLVCPSLARLAAALTLGVALCAGAQTPANQIVSVPMTVVTTTLPPNPANPAAPGGIESKLQQITDSGKLKLNPNVQLSAPAELVFTPPPGITPNTAGLGQAATTLGPLLTGWPVCGGFVNGKLQPLCPPEPAIFVAEAVGSCPHGSFFDPNGSCWACPDGFQRTADPVTGATACSKADASVPLKRMGATFQGGICPKGSFFDPIRGGECYSCPDGYRRSAAHIDAPNACYVPAGESLVKAQRLRKTPWPHDCKSGSFHDVWDGGGCWSCPAGYNRTGHHINSGQACSRAIGEKHATATNRGSGVCKPNEIWDPRNGGECWTCPAGTYRTVFPVTGGEACEQRAGVRLSKATQVSPFSCPAGSFMDLISSRDPNVQYRIQQQNAEGGTPIRTSGSLGATCWSCPPGFDRDITHVASPAACVTRSIKWQPAIYPQPGLFGFAGANEVARAVLAERRQLEGLIAAQAADTGMPLAQVRSDVYNEIVSAPQNSVLLTLAVYKRIEAAIANPAQASADERRLVAALAEHIRLYRSFIAKSALDAYDHWVEARPRQLAAAADAGDKATGLPSLERMKQNQAAFKGGEVPPEFMDIVAGMVAAHVLAPMTSQALLATVQTMPQLRYSIWPQRRARAALNDIRVMPETPKPGVPTGGQQISPSTVKSLKLTVGKKSTSLAKAGSNLAKAAMKFGPQIMVDLAFEMIVGTAEHFESVLNARPRLVTNLASAEQPVNLQREMTADDGWLYQQWALALGDGGKAPGNLGEFTELARKAFSQPADAGAAAAPTAAPTPAEKVWRQMPGAAQDIGVSPNSVIWMVGVNAVPGGFGIQRWNGKGWDNMQGGGVRLDVGPDGNAWVVNDQGDIFRYNGSGWSAMAGKAKDIGVGANGNVWVIGANAVAGGFGVYRWSGNAWINVPGGGVRIDVDAQDKAWLVNAQGQIFRFNGNGWDNLPGKAKDIGIGADGSVFVTGSDDGVYKWNGSSWIKRDGALTNITVDGRGVPFGVSANRQVWMGYP